jgi:phage terminase large subunit
MGKKGFDPFAKEEETINIDIKATRIFFENLESDKEITVDIGGGGSSKSHSIIQMLLYKLLTEEKKKILVVRKTMPSMRTSVIS